MDITGTIPDDATLRSLGGRIERQRIEARLTQAELAARAGVSKSTIERLERGNNSDLITLIRVLRELGLSTGFNALVPELPPSPLEQLKLRGRERKRVRHSAKAKAGRAAPGWQWGD